MPTFLSDPPPSLYMMLFVLVAITGAIAFRWQGKKSLGAFAAAALVLLAVWLVDRFNESPREQAISRVQAVKQAMNDRKPDALLANASESFDYNGKTKADLAHSPLWGVLERFGARVEAWDFNRDDVTVIDDNTIRIGFMAKGEADETKGRGQVLMYIQATFVRDPDGLFRVKTFKAFEPIDRRQEIPIPF